MIAFISDTHSNKHALEAVLDHIKESNVSKIYCLGDIIGYNTFPNETIELLKSHNVTSILGNHDREITAMHVDDQESLESIKAWTRKKISKESLEYLSNLPTSLKIKIDNYSAILVHGSPNSLEEYLYEDSREAESVMNSFQEDILICGHTHLPYYKKYNEKYLINAGSVGKPKVENRVATYVTIEKLNSKLNIDFHEVMYDYQAAALHDVHCGFKQIAASLLP